MICRKMALMKVPENWASTLSQNNSQRKVKPYKVVSNTDRNTMLQAASAKLITGRKSLM